MSIVIYFSYSIFNVFRFNFIPRIFNIFERRNRDEILGKVYGKIGKREKFMTFRVNEFSAFSMSDSGLPRAQDFDQKTSGSGQMGYSNNPVKFMIHIFPFPILSLSANYW